MDPAYHDFRVPLSGSNIAASGRRHSSQIPKPSSSKSFALFGLRQQSQIITARHNFSGTRISTKGLGGVFGRLSHDGRLT
jgi:hypothetical protein